MGQLLGEGYSNLSRLLICFHCGKSELEMLHSGQLFFKNEDTSLLNGGVTVLLTS